MHRFAALVLGAMLIVAACGSSSPTTAPVTGSPASASGPPSAQPSRAPASDDLRPPLPTSVGGHTLVVTPFTGQDFANNPGAVSQELVDLLTTLGRGPGDLTLAAASDPSNGTDLNTTAFKVRDVPVQTFLDSYLPLLKTANPAATIAQGSRAGKPIWNVTGQLGRPPQVLFASGDVLYVVSSATDSLVDAALTALH